MPVYSPLNTDRLKVTYTGPRGTHTMQFRKVAADTEADLIVAARTFCTTAATAMWNGSSFTNAVYSPKGSDIFLPVSWAPIVSVSGSIPNTHDAYGFYALLIGRTSLGTKSRLFVYNAALEPQDDSRYLLTESADSDILIGAWQTLCATTVFGAIDEQSVTPYPLTDVGINHKLAGKARRTL